MTEDAPRFYGRVVPSAEDQRLLDSGWFDTHHTSFAYPSGSWWRNGALVVDEQGPGLVDADGTRHSLPLPPWGGRLVYATVTMEVQGGVGSDTSLFVTDEGDHPVLMLPADGFSEETARGFADAAGLAFVVPEITDVDKLGRCYPGYDSRPHPYYDLRRSREDRERSVTGRMRRLLGRRSPDV